MASQFSKDGKYFAQLSVDGKLKIWDTAASKFEQEFTPDFHLTSPCTCLQFIQPTNSTRKSGSPRKKLKRRDSGDVASPYIVLGTTSGMLLVYSIAKADLDFTVNSKTSQTISCLSWQQGFEVYSAADQVILAWDLQEKTIKSKWKAGNEKITSILLLPDIDQLLTASRNIKLWNIKTKELLKTFTGHSKEVSILEFIDPGKSGSYFISGSNGDRLLSCWNLNGDSKNAVANFLMEDIATSISVSNDADGSTKLLAVTRSGVCHIYQHTLNGKGSKPLKPKKTVKVAADSADGKTHVTPIPIVSSQFQDDLTLMIAHGTAVLLVFENVVLNAYEKVQCLIRKDPRLLRVQEGSDISKTKTPLTDNVHYLTPHTTNSVTKRKAEGRTEVPMERRLENLTLNKLDGGSGVPKANNVAQLLLQGLHSKDKGILTSVLNNTDESVIQNTVRRLPMAVIVPLVHELTGYIAGKTSHCQIGSLWLKSVLQTHAGLLVSNPELFDILGPVLGSIESRLSLQMPLCRLKGRLDLLVSQVSPSNKRTNDSKEDEAVLVYNDKASSDSETEMLELGVHSESENEWLEESDDGIEENGDDNNSDEEMSS